MRVSQQAPSVRSGVRRWAARQFAVDVVIGGLLAAAAGSAPINNPCSWEWSEGHGTRGSRRSRHSRENGPICAVTKDRASHPHAAG